MPRIAYVNGQYRPHASAAVHIEDRGFQFADGIYEVVFLHRGRRIDEDLHLARFERSLGEIGLASPLSRKGLSIVMDEVARRNRRQSGILYLQVTRGSAPRAHAFPRPAPRPSLVVTLRPAQTFPATLDRWTATAITHPDERWSRCDIKSISLLANVLAREAATRAGATEAILYDRHGAVTEGSSTTIWIVDATGTLRTRPLDHAILPGCTRAALIGDFRAAGRTVEERAFTLDEMRHAREVILTAATSFVKPVLAVDGAPVGDGTIGPVARALFDHWKRRFS